MKLTDALNKTGVSAIVYGEAGAGKTHFLGTIPGKILLIAAEKNGIATLQKFPKEVKDRIELLFLPPQTGRIEDDSAAYNKFFESLMVREFEEQTIALDSATELANLLLIMKTDPNKNGGIPTMKNYGEVQFTMRRYLRILRDLSSIKGKNVVIIALEAELVLSQNADAQSSKTHPALSGKKLSPEAEGLYDIVAHLEKRSDGTRVFRLEGSPEYVAKDRFGRKGCLATGEALLFPANDKKGE